MTRANQTAAEQRHAQRFFRSFFRGEDPGLEFDSPAPPAPDVFIRGARLTEIAGLETATETDGLALEVTEYHPAAWGSETFRRTEVDSRWQNELLPLIEAARQASPVARSVAAWLDFKDVRLPKSRDHSRVARALIAAVEAAIPRIPQGRSVRVGFLPRDTVARLPTHDWGWTFLASEDFPDAAQYFNVICLESDPGWHMPFWHCPRMNAGWCAPSADEFGRILDSKARKARKYDAHGRPLWLLIVAELLNDQESHVFPRGQEYLAYLREQVSNTGFDFATGPFQQVWLFSEFTEGKVRLCPAGPAIS
jgi:hypothetical protein